MNARCNAWLQRVNHAMQKRCQDQGTHAQGDVTFKDAVIADKDKVQPCTPSGWAALQL
jgi:hypothetical protein